MSSDTNPPPEMEDFVRIENAKAEDLTESMVRIENATAEDLTESIVGIENSTAEASTESIVPVDEPRETDAESEPEPETEPEPESESELEPRPRFLPEELSRSVVVLECESSAIGGACDVHIIGTAHVSSESCREVEAIIRYLKPEVVFLELCPSRTSILLPQNLKVPTTREMIDMWKNNQNLFGILYSWFLAKVASQLEVFPGSEFRVGYEEAIKYGGRVILGDRPVQITLRRTWAKMPRWHKIKLIYSLLFQAVFLPSAEELNKMLKEMDDVDMITLVIQEMSKQFPTLMETLVHERDQYMSATLHGVASKNRSVVAVVGKGHLQGIQRHWKQPVMLMELLDVPKPANSKVRMFKALSVAAVGVAVMSGIYLFRKR